MNARDSIELLRPGLLEGVSILLAGEPAVGESFGEAIRVGFERLGGRVSTCRADPSDEPALDRAVETALAAQGRIDRLFVDGAGLFGGAARADTGTHGSLSKEAHHALRTCLDGAWNATRAVVNHAFLPAGGGGRIVYLAPPPEAGPRAEAARAGLENLARTLSVEWARHGITVVSIAPGRSTTRGEVAALAAYLASPAGAYFSGTQLDLRGVEGPAA